MTQNGQVQLTCPEIGCGSDNVVQLDCGAFGWMKCLTCGAIWQDAEEEKYDRSKPVIERVKRG